MNLWRYLLPVAALSYFTFAYGESTLGKINIQLYVKVIDYTCVADVSEGDKYVQMGTWTTREIPGKGDTTGAMPFSLNLSDCPPGGAITVSFIGNGDSHDSELLALNSASDAENVAIEILDRDKKRLPLQALSQEVDADESGNVRISFFARYIATASSPKPGRADADATFLVHYD